MQTFNSFNELAAGQTPLQSDMSVFNVSDEEYKKLADQAFNEDILSPQGINDAITRYHRWNRMSPELQQQIYDDLVECMKQNGREGVYHKLSGHWVAKGRRLMEEKYGGVG